LGHDFTYVWVVIASLHSWVQKTFHKFPCNRCRNSRRYSNRINRVGNDYDDSIIIFCIPKKYEQLLLWYYSRREKFWNPLRFRYWNNYMFRYILPFSSIQFSMLLYRLHFCKRQNLRTSMHDPIFLNYFYDMVCLYLLSILERICCSFYVWFRHASVIYDRNV
jgi:hypothetical protein